MSPHSLPTPAQLIVQNLTLLAGSPTAFHARYGHTITDSTFAKPAPFAPAAAVLHFLLSVIEPAAVHPLFKPCFPILDRAQERDFKRLVDARLALLEKNNLLPQGAARKSVVAAAGGDKFLDLIWMLSCLAVQHACVRNPPYANPTRFQVTAHPTPDDSASVASSSRSARSFHSFHSRAKSAAAKSSAASTTSSSSRRFLGAGMIAAAHNHLNNPTSMRATVDAQRLAMSRTVHMAHHGATMCNSEADSLRDKINDFEAKLRCLKMQLADMGFDENGNDIRGGDAPPLNTASRPANPAAPPPPTVSQLNQHELKTSPIESTESGSSLGDAVESVDSEQLSADLKRLLAFADHTAQHGPQLCHDLHAAQQADDAALLPGVRVADASAHDIVGLVRAATEQLEVAAHRIDQISAAAQSPTAPAHPRRASPAVVTSSSPPPPVTHRSDVDITSASSTVTDEEKAINEKQHSTQDTNQQLQQQQQQQQHLTNPLRTTVEAALKKHKQVLDTSQQLTKEANQFAAKSEAALKLLEPIDSDGSIKGEDAPSMPSSSQNNSKPSWFVEAAADAERIIASQRKRHHKSAAETSSADDVRHASRLLERSTSAHGKSSAVARHARRRKKDGSSRSFDSPSVLSHSSAKSVDLESDSGSLVLCTPSSTNSSATKTARSVRFAELPPSYSATRSCDDTGVQGSRIGKTRCTTEVYPSSPPSPSTVEDVKRSLQGSDKSTSRGAGNAADIASSVGRRDPVERSARAKTPTAKPSEPQLRKEGSSVRPRRRDQHTTKSDKGRPPQVTSGKPPRIQRTQTPRRVIRRKDAIERSVMPVAPASKSQNASTRPSRSASQENLKGLATERNSRPAVATGTSHTAALLDKPSSPAPEAVPMQIPREDETSKKAPGLTDAPHLGRDVVSPASNTENAEVRDGTDSLQSSTEESLVEEQPTPLAPRETVQKKLFMTPESTTSFSTPIAAQVEKVDSVEKTYGLRKATGTVKSILSARNGASAASHSFLRNTSPAPASTDSNPSGSLSDDELLFSPATRVPLAQKPMRPKATSSDGFFAGEAAQWQQSVRSQNGTELNMFREGALTRTTSESTSRFSRLTGRLSSNSSNSSGKKSRVQQLRARLAALNK